LQRIELGERLQHDLPVGAAPDGPRQRATWSSCETERAPDEPSPAPSGGRLSLAAEAQGAGDAFNLAGNPGGRGLLSGGGLGDGSGDAAGDGLGGGGPGVRFGRYYAKVATELEDAFRRAKHLSMLSARLELRIWIDSDGRITRIAPVREDVDPKIRDALQSVLGLRITEAPPADIPMPMVARLTARRPQ